MFFKVARCLLIVNEMVYGRMVAADLACAARLYLYCAEVHRLGIEGEQAVRQQITDTKQIFQCLGGLYGAEHSGNGTEYAGL